MRKQQSDSEYVSNNSFMTSRVKVPNPFGGDYEDPLEALKATNKKDEKPSFNPVTVAPAIPTIPSPSNQETANDSFVEINSFNAASDVIVAIPTTPTIPSPTVPTQRPVPTSPMRDFQKVSNSISREAIPSGLFGSGKAKQLYDALYSLTRGAIRPTRTVRITKPRLMKLAGIGTRQTLWLNLEHLESVGLVRKNVLLGEHGGNKYEVFVPEEVPKINLTTTPTTPTTPTSPSNRVYSEQTLEGVVGIDSDPAIPSPQLINTAPLDTFKTVFKDNTKTDDERRVSEAFSVLNNRLDAAAKKITGKSVSKTEAEKWGSLADLLILELEVAASRTDAISSVPAFLTEILRRQFFASRQQKKSLTPKSGKVNPDTVGKPDDMSSYEIKTLDKKEREAALEHLQEFSGSLFLDDFEKWYTAEDWKWLAERLKNGV